MAIATLDPEEKRFYEAHPKLAGKVQLFMDEKWRPRFDQYDATGFDRLLKWLDRQHKSDAQVVVIDPLSAASELAMHEMLKMVRSDDPKAIGHGGAYTGHDGLFRQLMPTQNRDAHGNVIEEERFDEQLLPAVMSSYRQEFARHFGLWLYTKTMGYGKARKFFLTALPDKVRPAKSKYGFKEKVDATRIPNNFKTLLDSIDESVMEEK
jgi:hypothetical protein